MDPKTMWGAGNYAAVAERISEVGELVVERAATEPGMELLDVACGAGNATIPAAREGARVTGLDFSADLLAVARERAADAMVEVDWVEGDAQELPFDDASFDRVISTFGHMFAPDHRRTAGEMKRVCRPGGTIAVACWVPDGSIGRMFRVTAELVPPPRAASRRSCGEPSSTSASCSATVSSSATRSSGRTSRSSPTRASCWRASGRC